PLLAVLRRPPTYGTRPLSGAKRKTEPFRFRPRSRTTATSILPSLNGKTAHSWRGIVPFTHLAREGRMTVTIGRRELLAALGGARVARSSDSLYCLHNGLNRDSWPIIGGYFPRPRCDSLAPSDSGKTDGQMQQSRGAAAENCVALEDTGGAAPTHPDRGVWWEGDGPDGDCGGNGRVAEHGEPCAHGL